MRGTSASVVVNPVIDDEGGKKRSGYYWSVASPSRRSRERRSRRQRGRASHLAKARCPQGRVPRSTGDLRPGLGSGHPRAHLQLHQWRRGLASLDLPLDRIDTQIASELITVVDDPTIPRGPGSRSYDGEGLLAKKSTIVEKGRLLSYQLDTYSGKKLNRPSTANASRGSSGGVGISGSNFHILARLTAAEEIVRSTKKGLLVTSMMGFGFNAVTGDFSRGASGFWVENGEITFPVSEVTISLNLDQLLKRIDAVGSDLDLKTSVASPTLRVSSMTLAGK